MKKYEVMELNNYNSDYEGDRDVISINTNEKGSLTRLSVDQNVNAISLVDFIVGKSVRGNHYHNIKDEYFYLVEGCVYGYFKDIDDNKIDRIRIEKGMLIHIKPGCVHGFETIENGYAVEFSSNLSKDVQGDSYNVNIVKSYCEKNKYCFL